MDAIVYASAGGSRYHADRNCRAFHAAHDLWRFDPQQWVPGMPQIMHYDGHPIRATTVPAAFGEGKEPCAVCLPGSRAAYFRGNAEDDFGHEPVHVNEGMCGGCETCGDTYETYVCARCYTVERFRSVYSGETGILRSGVEWPCASAVVLGLVPRDGRAAA